MIDYKKLCRIADSLYDAAQADAAERLANGEDPNDVFDYVDEFFEGFAVVKLNGKYNFIDSDGHLLSNQWFDEADDFIGGNACVKLNDKYNFINSQGNLISDQWFDFVTSGFGGTDNVALVELNGETHHIDTTGKIID